MVGKHHIVVESPRLKYEFIIKRNLTVIQGDSATGKTTLVEMLRDYTKNGNNGTIKINSDKPCVVFDGNESNWKEYLTLFKDSIVFIDEGHSFIRTKEFADQIRETDNYYVLITRDSLPCLPYSIHEIYGIRTSGKYHFPEQIYHEFYPIYEDKNELERIRNVRNTTFISEDSKAGFQFLQKCCPDDERCMSARGNSNIYSVMRKLAAEEVLVIVADGAAFGAYMEKVLNLSIKRGDVFLFLPESFEWLILKSGVIDFPELYTILEKPYAYIESEEYFSWERFFTDLLQKATAKDKIKEYHKDFLAAYYTEGKNRDRILAMFPKEIRMELKQQGSGKRLL